jgi:uncharacterized protein YgiB involved in biofilm formation
MKRSRTASLVVMGLSPLLLTACDDTQKSQQVFTTLENCGESSVPAAVCQQAYYQATAQAPKAAPSFASQDACAQQYDTDSCKEIDDTNGIASWHPAMYGFMIGRVIENGTTRYFPAGPVFHKRDDSYYSSHYGRVYATGTSDGWHSVSSSEAVGEGDTVGRGGFGGEGHGGEGGHGG